MQQNNKKIWQARELILRCMKTYGARSMMLMAPILVNRLKRQWLLFKRQWEKAALAD
nr:MAG TPA: hypothetical protein [Caudoviricetes sp.]